MATTLALTLLACPVLPPEEEARLAAPIRLEADGEVIDISEDIAYAGPWIHDVDADGRSDLIVTSISGKLRWFANVAEEGEPVYEGRGLIQAKGKPIEFWNW